MPLNQKDAPGELPYLGMRWRVTNGYLGQNPGRETFFLHPAEGLMRFEGILTTLGASYPVRQSGSWYAEF